jgi:hypothetical protein
MDMRFNTNNENGIFKITGPFLTLSSGCDISVSKTSGMRGLTGSAVFPSIFPSETPSIQNEGLNQIEIAALQLTMERHKKSLDILARD